MHKSLFAAAAAAAAFLPAHAGQASVTFTDNAGHYTPGLPTGYAGQGGTTPGFGAFDVSATGSAGTFLYTAGISEGDSSNSTIDSGGQSFGLFANNNPYKDTTTPSGPSSVTITRAFSTPEALSGLDTAGDSFSLDFVTGYNAYNGDNDGFNPSDVGVSLTDGGGTLGSFLYNADTGHYDFNGVSTGIDFTTGALHLDYTLTSATDYSLAVTGAVDYTGTGTFSSPITGFEVQQANAGQDYEGNHDAFFNNLSLTASNASPAPEPSEVGMLALMGLGLGGLMLRARKHSGPTLP